MPQIKIKLSFGFPTNILFKGFHEMSARPEESTSGAVNCKVISVPHMLMALPH